jgi:hypothetical protein
MKELTKMAKKPVRRNRKSEKSSKPAVKHTAVRYSAAPKVQSRPAKPAPKREITRELIAQRAYFISISGSGGSQDENWHRAELELRQGI